MAFKGSFQLGSGTLQSWRLWEAQMTLYLMAWNPLQVCACSCPLLTHKAGHFWKKEDLALFTMIWLTSRVAMESKIYGLTVALGGQYICHEYICHQILPVSALHGNDKHLSWSHSLQMHALWKSKVFCLWCSKCHCQRYIFSFPLPSQLLRGIQDATWFLLRKSYKTVSQ